MNRSGWNQYTINFVSCVNADSRSDCVHEHSQRSGFANVRFTDSSENSRVCGRSEQKKEERKRMLGHTFKGGIHPYDGKELSKDKAISSVLPKGELVYPLSQHIGAPAVPVVEKGEHVLVGQKIAEAGGFVSAPIHASVSGTVKGD